MKITSFMTYHRVCYQINTTGVTSGAGTAQPYGAHEFTPGVQWGSCYLIFSFICMFCRPLFVLLFIFFWPLCCLSFDIRILIYPLVSSNSFQERVLMSTFILYIFKMFLTCIYSSLYLLTNDMFNMLFISSLFGFFIQIRSTTVIEHVASFGYIILTPSQHVFPFTC